MRHLDLFSGIGGFALAAERVGWQTVAFCESDEPCRNVLGRYWPHTPIHHDITELCGYEGAADVITGGFPCQPFSSAAHGLNNATDLWPEMLRVIDECRATWVVAENVPGIRLGGIDRVCSDLEAKDYTVWPFDLDTALPQRQRGRHRIVWVAHLYGDREPRCAEHEEMAELPPLPRHGGPNDSAPVGMDDGLPGRMVRLQMLGNAIAWHSFVEIFRAIEAIR